MKPARLLLSIAAAASFYINAAAQNSADTAVKVDVLKAPVSPASSLLGLSPSDIEKPTDPAAVMISLRSATEGFSMLPNKYAVDIAPFLLFSKNGISVKDLQSVKFRDLMKQTFVLSTAINRISKADNKEDTTDVTKLGVGFKLSLIRGDLNKDFIRATRRIQVIQSRLLDEYDGEDDYAEADPQYKLLKEKADSFLRVNHAVPSDLQQAKEQLYTKLIDEYEKRNLRISESKKEISEALAKVTLDRYGWFMDFSGGVVMDFRNDRFENNKISTGGAWLTFGYDDPKGLSLLWISRYLYSPETVLAKAGASGLNLHTFDAGGRLLYKSADKKLYLSGEAIYRSVLTRNIVDPSWRLMFNASYETGINQKIIFSFGRNFDGTYFRGGNLVSSINFLIGLGKQRFNALQ
jgi:hypothetical protein